MRRDQVRSRAVRPDQGFAGENPAPAVVAGHVHALAGAGLCHRRTGGAQRKRRYQDGELKRPRDHHAVLHRLGCHLSSSIVAGFRFKALQGANPPTPGDRNYRINSMNWGNFGGRARPPLQNQSCPFKRGPPERWPSGLRRTLGKRVCGKPYRGFESHSLRHYTVLLHIRLFESTAKTTSSAIKGVAASAAMLPLDTAQTVAFDRGFGGWIPRGGTHGRQAQTARRRTRSPAR